MQNGLGFIKGSLEVMEAEGRGNHIHHILQIGLKAHKSRDKHIIFKKLKANSLPRRGVLKNAHSLNQG